MTKQLTERQAWKVIAEAYETERDDRTELQNDIAGDGICFGLDVLYSGKKISEQTYDGIRETIGFEQRYLNVGWLCGWEREDDLLRAQYCWLNYFMLGGE